MWVTQSIWPTNRHWTIALLNILFRNSKRMAQQSAFLLMMIWATRKWVIMRSVPGRSTLREPSLLTNPLQPEHYTKVQSGRSSFPVQRTMPPFIFSAYFPTATYIHISTTFFECLNSPKPRVLPKCVYTFFLTAVMSPRQVHLNTSTSSNPSWPN